MMTGIVMAFGLGIGTTLAGVRSYNDLLKKHADAKLSIDNVYLQGEVKRLRAQVALHIAKDDYPLHAFSADVRKPIRVVYDGASS